VPATFSAYFVMYDNGQAVVVAAPDKNTIGNGMVGGSAQTAIETALGTASH
jgi:hypothetical protein